MSAELHAAGGLDWSRAVIDGSHVLALNHAVDRTSWCRARVRSGLHRWVVEQSFALLHWFRRLRIRWEIRDGIHEAFLTLACGIICRCRLRNLPLWEEFLLLAVVTDKPGGDLVQFHVVVVGGLRQHPERRHGIDAVAFHQDALGCADHVPLLQRRVQLGFGAGPDQCDRSVGGEHPAVFVGLVAECAVSAGVEFE